MDVAAEKATALPRLGRPRMKLSTQASQTDQVLDGRKYDNTVKITRLTSADGRLVCGIDLVEELMTRDPAVARERVHHAAVGCDGECPAEKHRTNDDDLWHVISES